MCKQANLEMKMYEKVKGEEPPLKLIKSDTGDKLLDQKKKSIFQFSKMMISILKSHVNKIRFDIV